MREHALFAIRNVLKNNQANQDYVYVSSGHWARLDPDIQSVERALTHITSM